MVNPVMQLASATRDGTRAATTGVTLEVGAYACLAALALVLRLAAGSAPLSPQEAEQALAAHHLLRGDTDAVSVSGAVAPTLLALQSLLFFLFGVSDWTARLPVVLLTALTPATLWLWRATLGRRRALLAAALLTLSPGLSAVGGLGVGAGLAGVALLLAGGCLLHHRRQGGQRWAMAAGFSLGLALGCAAEAWAAVAIAAGIGLALRFPLPSRRTGSALAAGLGLSLLVATVAFIHPAGLQQWLEQAADLAQSLFRREPGALLTQVLLLSGYEPLLLLAGLAAFATRPATRHGLAVRLWTAVALLLVLLAGSPGFGLVLALPGLALLAARTLGTAWERFVGLSSRQRAEVLSVGFILVGYAVMALSGIARRGDAVFLLLLLTAVGIAVALLALLWMRDGRPAALAGAASVMLLLLTFWSVASCLQGAGLRRSLPHELTRPAVAEPGALDLAEDVAALSRSRSGFATDLALVVERDAGATVAWYLRDMRELTWVSRLAGELTAPALVGAGADLELSLGEYVGQDYAVSSSWSPQFGGAGELLRWLLYREIPVKTVDTHWVSLWVLAPADLAAPVGAIELP